MRVEIDSHSGFCFGVVRAISRAEEALQEQGEVFSLGDIVHNRVEVQRLERLGMHTVTHDQMPGLKGRSLFIRAHGEPPSTYRLAEELGIELIDFKLEFGRLSDGAIVLADEISPDTCRLWDSKTHEKLDKDRFRRDLGGVEEAYQEVMRRLMGE